MVIHRESRRRPRSTARLKHKTTFAEVHPVVIFIYYLTLVILAMFYNHPLFLGCEFVLLVLVNSLTSTSERIMKTLTGSLFMAVFIIILNPLLNNRGEHVMFSFGGVLITAEATLYGMLMAISLILLILIFLSYNELMTGHKFLYVFSRFLPQLALLTMITMRFVPMFMRRLWSIKQVQLTRGVQVETGSLKARAISSMKLVEVLLVNSLVEALQTSDSMTARGFGTGKRTSYQQYHFKQRDFNLLGLLIIGLGLNLFLGIQQQVGKVIFYPTLAHFELNTNSYLGLLSVMIIVGIPLWLEGGERLWWHLRKLKR